MAEPPRDAPLEGPAATMMEQPAAADRGRRSRAVFAGALAGFMYLIFLLKFDVISHYGAFNITYYDELADAFLAGQTYLLRDPPAELLALPDPWDPNTNGLYRGIPLQRKGDRFTGLHDLSLYHGKLYLQWGPLPALAIIPFRWLIGHDLPMGDVSLIVQTLAALGYAVVTLKLARLAGLPSSRLMTVLVMLLFVMFPIWTYNTRSAAIYDLGIYFAQFCLSGASLCLAGGFERLLDQGKKPGWLFAASSVLLGLAINCRIDLVLLGALIPGVFYIWMSTCSPRKTWLEMSTSALALGGPAAFLLACALLYNKLRFGGFLDIGQGWQLWGGLESMWRGKLQYLSFSRLSPNIISYFFLPPVELPQTGFFFVPPYLPLQKWLTPEEFAAYGDYYEITSGLFAVSPVTILSLLFPMFFFGRPPNARQARLRWILLLLFFAGVLTACLLILAPAVMRYSAQWTMWWLIASVLIALQIRGKLRSRGLQSAALLFDGSLIAATAWSCWLGICFMLVH